MKIVLSRVDERLVHGQVIASWSKLLEVKRILLIDESLAKDSFMADVMTMAAPTGVTVEVLSIDNAINKLNEDRSEENTMLLFKTVTTAYEMLEHGYPLSDLDIGNIGSGPNRKPISKRVFMSKDEMTKVKAMCDKGVNVYLRMLSTDPEVDVRKLI